MEAAWLMCSCCELPRLFPDIHLPQDKGKTAWKWWPSEYVMNVLSVWNKKYSVYSEACDYRPLIGIDSQACSLRADGVFQDAGTAWTATDPHSPLLLLTVWYWRQCEIANNGTCLDLIIRRFERESAILQLNVYSTCIFFSSFIALHLPSRLVCRRRSLKSGPQ